MRLGTGVGANDAELVLRSLASMPLRYDAQDQAARALAAWCAQQAPVAQVLHPALPGAPGHAHWRQVCVGPDGDGRAAGIFSLVIDARYSAAQVDTFCEQLRLFKLGYSWGGPMSLVMPYNLKSARRLPSPQLKPGIVVRLCIGLEDVPDLQADLAQAMALAFS
jgi:cystathionine beta-lyase